jgi:hypothetical protein
MPATATRSACRSCQIGGRSTRHPSRSSSATQASSVLPPARTVRWPHRKPGVPAESAGLFPRRRTVSVTPDSGSRKALINAPARRSINSLAFALRESTKQRSAKAADDILAKRKPEVAMRVHFPTRAFDAVTFAELADLLVAGARHRNAQPIRLPLPASSGVLHRQSGSRHLARRGRCVPGPSGHATEAVSVEHQSPPNDRERDFQFRSEAGPVRQKPGRRRSAMAGAAGP